MEDGESRLSRKMRENPFMPIGIVGFIGALAIGAYKYKRRGDMSTSLFAVQLRVAAQGMVVGSLCIGMLYSMGSKYIWSGTSDKKA